MKTSKKRILKIVITMLVGLVFVYVLYALYIPFLCLVGNFLIPEIKSAQQRQEQLFYETNYETLLDACRSLSKQVTGGKLKPGKYKIRIDRSPEALRFPQAILDLEPTYVDIDNDGRVMVELVGGIHHFGVYAYPEDYKAPFDSFRYGDKKFIDALWYYDDGYHENPDYYKKHIDELLRKRRAD